VTSAIFHPRKRSLVRGTLLVLASVPLTFWFSDFPQNRATPLMLFPAACVVLGTIDTARCLRPKWDFYHGGVILCLYMDLMAATMVFFSLLYPYLVRLAASR
jgi:hypothetical protein